MSFGFGFALPAYPLRGGGGNNPFNQLGPTLDLSFAGVVTDQSDPNGYTLNTNFIIPQYQIAAQYVVWETGVGLVDKTFSQIITFTRASGATWFNAAGNLVGVDFSVTSVTIGTGSKTFTLDATAGVNRSWAVGDSVLISQQSNSANNMTGTVTSYTASTQALVVNVTSTGGSGTITSWRVSSLTPRFDYNPSTLAAQGLLIEEARTNLTLQSEDFATTWTVTGATVSTNATTAPSGTTTADKLEEDTSTGSHLVTQNITFTAVSHTASIFAKKAERDWIRVLFFDGTNTFSAFFNLNTGTVGTITGAGATASIQNVGNGWYRCAVTATASAGSGSFAPRVALADNNSSYAGSTGSGIFIWGAQLEVGAFPTSYIPTTTTALTRSADVASVNTLSPWFNSVNGTLYVQGILVGGTAATFPYQTALVGSNANNDSIGVNWGANAGTMRWGVRVGAASQADLNAGSSKSAGSSYKVAGRYATNDFQVAVDGTLGTPDTTGSLPTITALSLGGPVSFQPGASVWLQRVTYYPRIFSNAELVSITS
jgi:hypothetical protein